MTDQKLKEANLAEALKQGLITWPQYLEVFVHGKLELFKKDSKMETVKVNRDERKSILRIAFAIVCAIALVGCAKPSGGSKTESDPCESLAGEFFETYNPSRRMTISNQCTYTDTHCGYDASFTYPVDGMSLITIHGTAGTPGCMSNTTHSCDVEFTGTQLAISCDGGAYTYLYTLEGI